METQRDGKNGRGVVSSWTGWGQASLIWDRMVVEVKGRQDEVVPSREPSVPGLCGDLSARPEHTGWEEHHSLVFGWITCAGPWPTECDTDDHPHPQTPVNSPAPTSAHGHGPSRVPCSRPRPQPPPFRVCFCVEEIQPPLVPQPTLCPEVAFRSQRIRSLKAGTSPTAHLGVHRS